MKSIDLKMFKKKGQNDEQELVFNATEVSEEQGTMIIANMFAAFGVENPIANVPRKLEAVPAPVQQAYAEVAAAAAPVHSGPVERITPTGQHMIDDIVLSNPKPTVDLKTKQNEELQRAKTLPLAGASNNTYAIMDDPKTAAMLQAAADVVARTPKAQERIDENPSHIYTGVKVKDIDGIPTQTFKCRCNCPSCGWRNNRYVLPTDNWAKCYDCGAKLAIVPATENDMVPDAWMNFFMASELYYDAAYEEGTQHDDSGQHEHP